MVGLHGAGDRAEWSCGEWRGVTDAFSFVFCPHGNASHLYWDTPQTARAQIAEGHAYVATAFAPYFQASGPPAILAAFSAGTSMAVSLVRAGLLQPEALVLVEGAYDAVADDGFAEMLERRHVRRILLVCTTRGVCPRTYLGALPRVKKRNVEARVNLASEREHGMYPEVISSIKKDWPWLVRDLEGWQEYAPAP
jgi:hypothetical protein